MKGRQRALTGVIAICGLLAFVVASWLKQLTPNVSSELQTSARHHYVYCAGPASASAYLAEIKPRFIGIVAGSLSLAASSPLSLSKCLHKYVSSKDRINDSTRRLWLVNRSLLI